MDGSVTCLLRLPCSLSGQASKPRPPPHSFPPTQDSILGHGLVSASLPQASPFKRQPQNSGKTHSGHRSVQPAYTSPPHSPHLRELGDDAYLPPRTTHAMMGQLDRWSTRYDTLHGRRRHVRALTTPTFLLQFSLSADPSSWNVDRPEPDDELHRPDPRRDVLNDSGAVFTLRGLVNLGCVILLLVGLITLLYVSALFFRDGQSLMRGVFTALDTLSFPISPHRNSLAMMDSTMAGPMRLALYVSQTDIL